MLVIFSTARHLPKSAPSFLYWAQRSASPSSPADERTVLHESSSSGRSSEKCHDTSQGCNSGESPHGFCCRSHSVGSLDLSLPWMVVSPFVPARGAVPLSSCGGQKNRKGYREMEISLIFVPTASVSLQADRE